MKKEAIQLAAESLELQLTGTGDFAWEDLLANRIDHLIHHDFQKLISILYRMDVSELKLKKLLADNPDSPAGQIIATLMIERQLEKIKTREKFNKKEGPITGEEAW